MESIRNIDYVEVKKEIFSVPNGYDTIREGGNFCIHNGKVIWVGTCDYKKDGERLYSLHYWTCNVGDLENWTYGGELIIQGGGGYKIMGEDPNLWFDGKFHLQFENKSYEAQHKMHTIGYAIGGASISDVFMFQGGSTGLSPSYEDNYWENGVYSPHKANKRTDLMYFGGRKITVKPHTEVPAVAKWNDKWNPLANPLFNGADYGFQSCDFGSDVFEDVDGKCIALMGGLRGWTEDNKHDVPPPFYHASGIAQGDTLTNGWKVIKEEIRDQDGKIIQCYLLYLDGWKMIGVYKSGKKAYLLKIVENGTQPPIEPPVCRYIAEAHPITRHINNDHDLPLHSGSVADNVILMREAKPLIKSLTIPEGEEIIRQRIIDLIDEIS